MKYSLTRLSTSCVIHIVELCVFFNIVFIIPYSLIHLDTFEK
jgi:predicted membrane protein